VGLTLDLSQPFPKPTVTAKLDGFPPPGQSAIGMAGVRFGPYQPVG
jgi:hypothetical protein